MKRDLLSLGAVALACSTFAPLALAQRGGDRGGDRGSSRGGDRGGDRGERGGDRESRFGGRGGFGPPGGGFGGGGFGGGGFGGPPGGFGGGGGFGGPPGGFSPIDMLKRFDRNGNNMLDPDEREGPARFFLERMAQNNPRIDLSRPVPLDRLAEEMDRMRQDRMGGGPGGPGGAPTSTNNQPAEPEPLVPGFDKVEEPQAVQGFGLPDPNSSIKVEERDLREADERMRRYDSNKDGVLSQDELRGGRWSDDPLQFDRNRDGKLNKSELAVRYAKQRLAEQEQGGNNNDPRGRFAGMNPWGGRGGENRGGFPGGGFPGGGFPGGGMGGGGAWGGRDSGNGWGSREEGGDRGGSEEREKKEDAKSYRAGSVRNKADTTKGLPDWFARSDANGDGQVMMSEYSTSWSDAKVAEFAKFDLNSDGIITARECLTGLKNGATASSNSTASSTSSGPSSPGSSSSSSGGGAAASTGDATRDWAKKQIDRYDKNGDGQLTVNEWSAMIIKPDGADADKDGIVTLDEYAKFRAGK